MNSALPLTAEDRAIYARATIRNDDRSDVAALMAEHSHRETYASITGDLPFMAAYCELSIAQMVRNRINARAKMATAANLIY